MEATYSHSVRSKKTGKLRYAFVVTGTDAELKLFKQSQGSYYDTNDDNQPLYYTSFLKVKQGPLKISKAGKPYIDTSELDVIKAQVESQGGDWGNLYGEALLKDYLGKQGNSVKESPSTEPETGNKDVGSL